MGGRLLGGGSIGTARVSDEDRIEVVVNPCRSRGTTLIPIAHWRVRTGTYCLRHPEAVISALRIKQGQVGGFRNPFKQKGHKA